MGIYRKIKMTVSEIGICILDLNFRCLNFLFISLFQAYLRQWHMRNRAVEVQRIFNRVIRHQEIHISLPIQDGIAHMYLVIIVA